MKKLLLIAIACLLISVGSKAQDIIPNTNGQNVIGTFPACYKSISFGNATGTLGDFLIYSVGNKKSLLIGSTSFANGSYSNMLSSYTTDNAPSLYFCIKSTSTNCNFNGEAGLVFDVKYHVNEAGVGDNKAVLFKSGYGNHIMWLTGNGDLTVKRNIYTAGSISNISQGPEGGAIDFTDNKIGYKYATKFFTFRTADFTTAYGMTQDFGTNTSAQLSLIATQDIGNIGFYTGNSGIERMRIASNGYVGIGTIAPGAKLDVNGVIRTYNIDNSTATWDNLSMWSDGSKSFIQSNGDDGGGLFIKSNGANKVVFESYVGIGTNAPDEMLTVKGNIHALAVLVDLNGPLADFVFAPSYKLKPLAEVEAFVKENKHLPEIPSAAEVAEKGINLGDMQNKLLQKVEELTLYAIEQQKLLAGQQTLLANQQAQIEELKKIVGESRK